MASPEKDHGGAVKRFYGIGERQRVQARLSALIWAVVAMLSLTAALTVAATDRGRERIAALFGATASGISERAPESTVTDDVAQISAEIVKLRTQMRLIALENEAIGVKLARLEGDQGSVVTASLPQEAGDLDRPEGEPRRVYPPMPTPRGSASSAESEGNSTRFLLEIGSGGTRSELDALWHILSVRNDAILDGLIATFAAVTTEDGGQRLLLRAGPIDNAADATAACAGLHERGAACSIVSEDGRALDMP